jgi:hypothetical protein
MAPGALRLAAMAVSGIVLYLALALTLDRTAVLRTWSLVRFRKLETVA